MLLAVALSGMLVNYLLSSLLYILVQVKEALLKNIKRRMTPQPLKIRADVELTCFAYDGVERIRDAMRAAEAASTEDCPVRMKLVAPPLYVLTTQTLDKNKGIEVSSPDVNLSTPASWDSTAVVAISGSVNAVWSRSAVEAYCLG